MFRSLLRSTLLLAGGLLISLWSADAPPTVTTAAAATPAVVTSKTTKLTVLGADDGGAAGLLYTWSASGPAKVTFSTTNGTNAAKSLTATFSAVGAYDLTATIADATGQTVTTTVPVTVSSVLTSLAIGPTSAAVNPLATKPFVATAKNQFGVVMPDLPLIWTATGNGSVDAVGLFSASETPGTASVAVSTGGKTATAAIRVNAAPTVAVAASTETPVVVGKTAAFTVQGADDVSVDYLNYTWSATGPKAVSFAPRSSTAGEATTATFAAAGSYTITATITDKEGLTSSSAAVVSVVQTPTGLSIAPSTNVAVSPGATKAFAATVKDQFNTLMVQQPSVTWVVAAGPGGIDQAGTYTAAEPAGSATISASVGAAAGSVSLRVNAAPTVAVAVATETPVVIGKTAVFTVQGADDVSADLLTYTWSATGPKLVSFSPRSSTSAESTTATFAAAGSYAITATITDKEGLTATSTTTVTVTQTVAALAVSPSSNVVVNPGLTKPFIATTRDQFNALMVPQSLVTWAVTAGNGSIGSDGIYVAGDPGQATVAASVGPVTGSATLRINAPPTVAQAVATDTPTITGLTAVCTVRGADDVDPSLLSYNWSASGPKSVSFAPRSGTSAASTTATFTGAGSYTITATITDKQGLKTASSLVVTVQQVSTGFGLYPSSAVLNPRAAKLFVVQAHDQFNAAIAGAAIPAVAWSASGGTIDGAGRYAAGASPGTGMVTAVVATPDPIALTADIRINAPPAIAAPAATSGPNPTTVSTIPLNVQGADDGGESNLRYTWSVVGSNAGGVIFGGVTQNTMAARTIIAQVPGPGVYRFNVLVRDAQGLGVSSAIEVELKKDLLPPNPIVRAEFVRGLSGDKQGLVNGVSVAYAHGPTLGVSVNVDQVGGGLIQSVYVTDDQGHVTTGQSGSEMEVTLLEGSHVLRAGAVVLFQGNPVAMQEVSLNVVVDATPPDVSGFVVDESYSIEARPMNDLLGYGAIVVQDGNAEAGLNRAYCGINGKSSWLLCRVHDGSGISTKDMPRANKGLSASIREDGNVRIDGLDGLPLSATVSSDMFLSGQGVQKIVLTITDKAGNTSSLGIADIWRTGNEAVAKMGYVPYSTGEIASTVGVLPDGRTSLAPVRLIATTADVEAVYQVVSGSRRGCRRMMQAASGVNSLIGKGPVLWALPSAVGDNEAINLQIRRVGGVVRQVDPIVVEWQESAFLYPNGQTMNPEQGSYSYQIDYGNTVWYGYPEFREYSGLITWESIGYLYDHGGGFLIHDWGDYGTWVAREIDFYAWPDSYPTFTQIGVKPLVKNQYVALGGDLREQPVEGQRMAFSFEAGESNVVQIEVGFTKDPTTIWAEKSPRVNTISDDTAGEYASRFNLEGNTYGVKQYPFAMRGERRWIVGSPLGDGLLRNVPSSWVRTKDVAAPMLLDVDAETSVAVQAPMDNGSVPVLLDSAHLRVNRDMDGGWYRVQYAQRRTDDNQPKMDPCGFCALDMVKVVNDVLNTGNGQALAVEAGFLSSLPDGGGVDEIAVAPGSMRFISSDIQKALISGCGGSGRMSDVTKQLVESTLAFSADDEGVVRDYLRMMDRNVRAITEAIQCDRPTRLKELVERMPASDQYYEVWQRHMSGAQEAVNRAIELYDESKSHNETDDFSGYRLAVILRVKTLHATQVAIESIIKGVNDLESEGYSRLNAVHAQYDSTIATNHATMNGMIASLWAEFSSFANAARPPDDPYNVEPYATMHAGEEFHLFAVRAAELRSEFFRALSESGGQVLVDIAYGVRTLYWNWRNVDVAAAAYLAADRTVPSGSSWNAFGIAEHGGSLKCQGLSGGVKQRMVLSLDVGPMATGVYDIELKYGQVGDRGYSRTGQRLPVSLRYENINSNYQEDYGAFVNRVKNYADSVGERIDEEDIVIGESDEVYGMREAAFVSLATAEASDSGARGAHRMKEALKIIKIDCLGVGEYDSYGAPSGDPITVNRMVMCAPSPTVAIGQISCSLTQDGQISVTITGKVSDSIADLYPRGAGADLTNIRISVGTGQPAEEVVLENGDLGSQGFWRPHAYEGTFRKTVIIPYQTVFPIRVETAENMAGQRGYASTQVVVDSTDEVVASSVYNICLLEDANETSPRSLVTYYGMREPIDGDSILIENGLITDDYFRENDQMPIYRVKIKLRGVLPDGIRYIIVQTGDVDGALGTELTLYETGESTNHYVAAGTVRIGVGNPIFTVAPVAYSKSDPIRPYTFRVTGLDRMEDYHINAWGTTNSLDVIDGVGYLKGGSVGFIVVVPVSVGSGQEESQVLIYENGILQKKYLVTISAKVSLVDALHANGEIAKQFDVLAVNFMAINRHGAAPGTPVTAYGSEGFDSMHMPNSRVYKTGIVNLPNNGTTYVEVNIACRTTPSGDDSAKLKEIRERIRFVSDSATVTVDKDKFPQNANTVTLAITSTSPNKQSSANILAKYIDVNNSEIEITRLNVRAYQPIVIPNVRLYHGDKAALHANPKDFMTRVVDQGKNAVIDFQAYDPNFFELGDSWDAAGNGGNGNASVDMYVTGLNQELDQLMNAAIGAGARPTDAIILGKPIRAVWRVVKTTSTTLNGNAVDSITMEPVLMQGGISGNVRAKGFVKSLGLTNTNKSFKIETLDGTKAFNALLKSASLDQRTGSITFELDGGFPAGWPPAPYAFNNATPATSLIVIVNNAIGGLTDTVNNNNPVLVVEYGAEHIIYMHEFGHRVGGLRDVVVDGGDIMAYNANPTASESSDRVFRFERFKVVQTGTGNVIQGVLQSSWEDMRR